VRDPRGKSFPATKQCFMGARKIIGRVWNRVDVKRRRISRSGRGKGRQFKSIEKKKRGGKGERCQKEPKRQMQRSALKSRIFDIPLGLIELSKQKGGGGSSEGGGARKSLGGDLTVPDHHQSKDSQGAKSRERRRKASCR